MKTMAIPYASLGMAAIDIRQQKGIHMRILVVEDDQDLALAIKTRLEQEGYAVDLCQDGEEGLYYMRERIHDLVLLDRMLPEMDGISALRQARREKIGTPVILLTALGTLKDRVTGLDCGADDYLVKPFAFQELLARIRSILRRPAVWEDPQSLSLGDITFQVREGRLSRGEKECTLSKREGALLEIFLRNPGQVLTRSTLLLRVWGLDSDVEEGNLDNYIHFLRRRLRAVGSSLSLKTVRGTGYYLEAPQ